MEKKQEKNFTNLSENDFGITEYLNTKKKLSSILFFMNFAT